MRDRKKYLEIVKEKFPHKYIELLSPEEQERVYDSFLSKSIDNIPVREAEVVALYLGLNQRRPLTLEKIGEKFNLTRERIRVIKENAYRKLYNTSLKSLDNEVSEKIERKFLDGSFGPEMEYLAEQLIESKKNYEKLLSNYDNAVSTFNSLRETLSEYIPNLEKLPDRQKLQHEELLNTSIYDLDFSVRVKTVFRVSEIKTLKDLVQKNRRELLKHRNFGRRSLREIEQRLESYGLSLDMKLD